MYKLISNINFQPFIYLISYYYSYSFLYECPKGKEFFKKTLFLFHYNKKIKNNN